jgi:hypothetical protein
MLEKSFEQSESQEAQGPPLSMEHFGRVQNNFFLQFVDQPLNTKRYQISSIVDALKRSAEGEIFLLPLKPMLVKLREENPALVSRLTEEMTKKDQERKEMVIEHLALLYEAYLLQRKYLQPNEDEWKVFDFFEPN